MDASRIRKKKFAFSQISGYVWTGPNIYMVFIQPLILLSMPAVRSKITLSDRSFMVAAPTFWNSLPKELRAITNVNSFKAHLKTYVFGTVFVSYLLACIYVV